MKKNDVFTFTTPDGVELTAVVIDLISTEVAIRTIIYRWICYAQNRIFIYIGLKDRWNNNAITYKYNRIIAEYAVIPELDSILEDYQHQLDMADDYASREY